MEDNYSKLYKAMVNSGYDTADLGGSEEDFRREMQDSTTRKNFYDWVSNNEMNGFRIGSYDAYEERLAPTKGGENGYTLPADELGLKEETVEEPKKKSRVRQNWEARKDDDDEEEDDDSKAIINPLTPEQVDEVAQQVRAKVGITPDVKKNATPNFEFGRKVADINAPTAKEVQDAMPAAQETLSQQLAKGMTTAAAHDRFLQQGRENSVQVLGRGVTSGLMSDYSKKRTGRKEQVEKDVKRNADVTRVAANPYSYSADPYNQVAFKSGATKLRNADELGMIEEFAKDAKNRILTDETLKAEVQKEADLLEMSLEDYVDKIAVPALQQRMYEEWIAPQEEKAKENYNGVMAAAEGSLIGMLLGATRTDTEKYLSQVGQEAWRKDASILDRALSGAGSMFLDLPIFGGFGSLASVPTKYVGGQVFKHMAKNEAKKVIARGASEAAAQRYANYAVTNGLKNRILLNLSTSPLQSGLTFGMFDAGKAALNMSLNGEWDWGELGKSAGGGFLLGAALGGTNAVGGALTHGLTGATKAGAKVAEFAVENAVFTEGGRLIGKLHGQQPENGWLEDYVESGATLLMLKAPNIVKNVSAIKGDKEASEVFAFNKLEREQLGKYGEDLNAVLESLLPQSKRVFEDGLKISEGTFTEEYRRVMSDPEVSMTTKAKLMGIVEGKVMPAPRVVDAQVEGNRVMTYDPMGRLVEVKEYATEAKANAEYKKVANAAEIESIAVLEDVYMRIKGYEADELTVKEWLAKNPKVTMERVAEIVAKNSAGEKLTDAEQKILESLRQARREGLNDVRHLNDVLAGLDVDAKDVMSGLNKPIDKRTERENRAVRAYTDVLFREVKDKIQEPYRRGEAQRAADDVWRAANNVKWANEDVKLLADRIYESDRQIDETANDGMIYTTTNNKGEKIIITGGKVVLDNEGYIDVNQSEGLVALMPDGTKKPVRVDELREKVEVANAEEIKAVKREEIANELADVIETENEWWESLPTDNGEVKTESGKPMTEPMADASQNGKLVPGAEIEIAFDGEVYKLKVEGRDERGDIILSGEGASMAVPESAVLEGMKEAERFRNGEVKGENQIEVAPVATTATTEMQTAPVTQAETVQPQVVAPKVAEVTDFFRMDGKNYAVVSRNEDGSVTVDVDGKRAVLPAETNFTAAVPTDKGGKVLFTEMPAEKTLEYFVQRVPNSQARAQMIENNRKQAESALKKYDKEPNVGTDPDAYEATMNKWEADKKAAQAKVDYWNEVAKRDAEISQSEMRESVEAVKPREVIEMTPDEFVANQLGGIKITPESFQKETGTKAEQKQMVGVIAGKEKGGVSIERAAEIIYESYGDELRGLGFNGDMQDVRDMIIDVLSNGNPRSFARKGLEMRQQADVEQQLAELRGVANALNFESIEEQIAYEESIVPRIMQELKGFDETEYFNNLAENYENDTTRESENTRGSSELLQGKQPADNAGTGNIAEPGQGGEIQGDVYSSGENATPQGNQQVSSPEIPNNLNRDNLSLVEGAAEGGNAPGQSGVSASLVKGTKWENTGEPDKIKFSRKKGDSHDITWYIGKKKYGSTTAERDLLVVLAEDYGGDLNAVWNAYEQGEVLLSANEAAILKKLIETNTSVAELQQGTLELDRENPAFERATKVTMDAVERLKENGLDIEVVSQEEADAMMELAEMQNAEMQTSKEIEAKYPDWLEGTTTESGKHSTQVEGTRKTYKKIGDWIEENLGMDVAILDASSGMGYGTADLRERGFNIEDVEPYQSEDRKQNNPATYSSYADIDKQYDYIISNAVLNVIPDDWRTDVLHNMADKLKDGGKLFINTRKAGEERSIKDKIELDSPQEVLVKRNGRIASYQRFFTPQELKGWIESELGNGYTVEIANKANSGTNGLAAVVVTKNNESPANGKTSELGQPILKKKNAPLANVAAKVSKNAERASRLDAIISSIEKIGEMGPHEFLHEIVNAMLLSQDISTEKSRYAKLGGGVTMRLANHYGNAETFKEHKDQTENYGLVIKLSNNPFKPDKDVDYLEYVYFPDKLTKERQIEIAKGLKAFMETGRYDLLPKPDKVNPSGKFVGRTELSTTDGKVYGWAVDGKIRLTPDGINPNTPVHEYVHLWGADVEKNNPKLWKEVVEAMKLSPVWNEVANDANYSNIHGNDSRMASEVLARLSGRENYRRTMEEAEKEIAADRDIVGKVQKKGILNRIKNALKNFWNWVQRNVFRSGKRKGESGQRSTEVMPWEEFANSVVGDFYKGKNPNVKESPLEKMLMGEKGAENLDKAEEATTRLDNLNVAREMESAGKDAKAIKLATGWERGADGKWRYETEDVKLNRAAELFSLENHESYPIAESLDKGRVDFNGTIKLADLVLDEELFKAYPGMEKYYVSFEEMSANVKGEHDVENTMIRINKDDISELESTLVHEIQHAIQSAEGFAMGGSTSSSNGLIQEVLKTLHVDSNYPPSLSEVISAVENGYITRSQHEELVKIAQSHGYDDAVEYVRSLSPYSYYHRLAGEVESRNVEERMGMSPEERRNKLAEETEDVSRKDQIFLEKNLGVSANEEVTSGKKITYDEVKKESAVKSAVKNNANFVSTYKTKDGKDIEYTSERAEGYGIQGGGTGNSYDGTGNSILQRQTDTGVPGGNSGLNTEKGEFCVVERVFTENGAFNFTSGEKIESADDVAYIFSALEDAAKEHSFVVYVKDGKPTVIELGMGSFNATMVDIPTASLAYSRINPDHVYFVHNHPAGTLVCSGEDVAMLRMFEDMSDVPVTGVIINLKTGKYGTFDTERHSVIGEKRVPENEERLTVHTLDKQIFAPDYDPMAQPLVRSSQDVAQFLNSQRMGDRPKVSFLILSRANRIIGNIHTPFTDITTDTETVARYINERVIQFGGENAILYGDFAISMDESRGFRLLQGAMERFGKTKLLDVVHVEGNFTKSAIDLGLLYEPEMEYNVAKENGERYNSPEQDIPVGEVESKPISRIDLSNGPVKGVNEPEWKFKARREKWRKWVESNTDVKTPMPEKPFLQEGESIEEYAARMKEFNKELNKWKKDILSNESEIEKMMDILYDGKIPEMDSTPEDEFTEQVFKRYMGDDGIKVDRKSMRGMIMDEIIERRRKIETNNFDDVVFIDKVRKATTAEQRKAIPFIIEGTYNGKLSPELASVVNRIRDWFENVYQALQAADAMHSSGKIKNYVTHIWDKARTPKAVYENYINTRSKYTNRRSIETYAEGIALGMVPKYDDICDIMLEYGHIANEAIANKDFTDFLHMLRVDGEPVLKDATIRDPMYVRTSAEALDGYKVHKYAKGIVETVLGNIRTENAAEWMQKLAHFYDMTGSLMKKINLSLSFFHHGALIETAVGAMGPAKTISTVFKNLVWDCMKSGELPALSNPEAARNAVNHLVQLGATQDYMAKEVNRLTGRLKEMLQDFSDKHPNFATKSIVKPAELLDFLNTGFDKVLWDYLHDGLKIYTFDKYAKEIEEYCKKKGVDDTTKDMLLNEAGQFVNDTFGGQFWELIHWSPATVKWMRRLLLSPDWTVSTIRQALAPLGFGTLYKDYEKNWFKRTFSGIPEAVTQRRKMGAKFWIIAMLTFIPLMNALNAWRRKDDVDEELKKAEERRKTDPEYKSPYELKYPEGMKWYDYTMYGNTIGHQTHLFGWRCDDGKEGYIRWGKQFRELPELFLGKDGFSFPGPMIDKMVGKANPALSASLAFLGYAKDGWQSKWMKDKKGWEKELGRVMMMASAFMPYSIPTDEDKEFMLTDLMMPSSKGFSNNKAIREFETAILAQDMDFVGAVYDACVMNKLDAEKLLQAAIARVEAQAKAEYVEGANTLNEAWDKYQEDLDVNEKRAVRAKFNKLLQENAYKDFEKQEARDMVQSALDGTYREEKLPDAYVANETPDDVRDAYKMDAIRLRLKKVVDGLPEDAEAYEQYYKDNETKIDLYDEVVAARREINLIMEDIKMYPQQTEQFMQEIRDIRREIIELANNLTGNNE